MTAFHTSRSTYLITLSVQSLVPGVTNTPRRRRFPLYGRRPQHPPSLPFRASSRSRSHWKWMGLTSRRMPLHRAPRGSVLRVAVAHSHALPSTNPFIKRIPHVAVDGHSPFELAIIVSSIYLPMIVSPRYWPPATWMERITNNTTEVNCLFLYVTNRDH